MRRAAAKSPSYLFPLAAAAVALAAAAVVNHRLARKAERDNPPTGRLIDVNGVQLHYVERGEGTPLVLLHGNGSMIQDFEISGLIDRAARQYRVIAFDRPGFGHSKRPRGTAWTAAAQADLLRDALARIGVESAVVLGHSWGCSVAMALAQRHPASVKGLVLASGYHYPSVRLDAVALSVPAIPIIGDIIRYTATPILSRLLWPLLTRRLFAPAPVPERFKAFPREMSLRPWQLRASAAESALMVPQALAARPDYAELKIPVAIIAGDGDRLVNPEAQSARLHDEIRQSSWQCVAGTGHMVHHSALDATMSAIERVSREGLSRSGSPVAESFPKQVA
jgi:pimeloyl-ACP methyl ester carboxylesterase